MQHVGSLYPDHGLNLPPLPSGSRVLTTGPLDKSHVICFLVVFCKACKIYV